MGMETCSVDGCERLHYGRGYCSPHYQRWRRYGDPLGHGRPIGTGSPAYGSGRRINQDGYVYLWRPGHPLAHRDGYVAEHRFVLHEAGIEIPPDHDVHHRNGDKQDNSIENLEILPNSDHTLKHKIPGTTQRNQYGKFPILAPEDRLERQRAQGRENQRRLRAKRRSG